MCWKEEWAYAIRDINKAIGHIEKAQKKIEGRRSRSQKWYGKLSKDKKHGTPTELDKVQEIIDKNNAAIDESIYIVDKLRTQQQNLKSLIEKFGISRKPSGSLKVKKILKEAFES